MGRTEEERETFWLTQAQVNSKAIKRNWNRAIHRSSAESSGQEGGCAWVRQREGG